ATHRRNSLHNKRQCHSCQPPNLGSMGIVLATELSAPRADLQPSIIVTVISLSCGLGVIEMTQQSLVSFISVI
ncbi:MAG: hypothetical protein WCJ35_24105, partial [Planctomycetota bacterium]